MASVVIAAHDEATVIGACLDALAAQRGVGHLEVIVSANGCRDDTAAVAASHDEVVVVDRPEPGKAGALNAGEERATSFPRVYLDADIVAPPDAIAALTAALDRPGILAAVPRRRLDARGRPWPVRAYTSINERLPAFRNGLFGRGMIALSEEGRGRFDAFPELVADDLFLDSQFADDEKAEVAEIGIDVAAPRTTRDLLHRLVRVRRGNAEMRAAAAAGSVRLRVRPADRWAWFREVVVPEPRLAPAAVAYVAITLAAALLARRPARGAWERDESTRGTVPQDGEGVR